MKNKIFDNKIDSDWTCVRPNWICTPLMFDSIRHGYSEVPRIIFSTSKAKVKLDKVGKIWTKNFVNTDFLIDYTQKNFDWYWHHIWNRIKIIKIAIINIPTTINS